MAKLFYILAVLACVISPGLVHANGNGTAQRFHKYSVPVRANTDAIYFNEGNEIFTAKFLNNIVDEHVDESVVMSPYSSMFLLAQVAMYASGQSLTELLSLFNFQNKDQITSSIPKILEYIDQQQDIIFKIAAKSYANAKYTFKDSYKRDTKNYFNAEAENIDFSNPGAAAKNINSWVADHTNNKIQDLIGPTDLSPETQIVLTNAVYFLGSWIKPFDVERTKPADFYTSKGETVRVDMMNNEATFNYGEINHLNAKALELKYRNNDFSFLVILNNDKNDERSLLTKLADPAAIRSIKQYMKFERVNVSLPKFKTTTSIDLKHVLEQVGVKEIFQPGSTGLNGLIEDIDTLFVSSAIQKANIVVDEKGSEASAANALVLLGGGFNPGPPKEFNANTPFFYYILFDNTPIFCGFYTGK